MAKKSSPWYWKARRGWYVHYKGQRRFLGAHPADASLPEKSRKTGHWNSPPTIDTAFRNLMDGRAPAPGVEDDTVVMVLDDFITWCQENRAPMTATRYEQFCQDFVKARTDKNGLKLGEIPVSRLSSKHVTQWLNDRPTWGSTTKRNAITALIRGFNWAVKNRGLSANPIKAMEKPSAQRRTEIVTPEEFEKVLAHTSPDFNDLVIVSYDSGARPFEVKDLQARHIQLDKRRAVLPAEESKGRQHPRTFYFPTERSWAVVSKLCAKYPRGPLFRNRRGRKWTGNTVKCTFARLDKILGRRISHYMLRHAFVTRKIVAGVDSHVVAKLSGHRDTKMVDTVYSHVADDYEFMLREASKDISPKKDASK